MSQFIPHATIERTILIDDRIEYIHPNQKDRWLEIPGYEYPDPDNDRELDATIDRLHQRTDR
jgi:hypothetical protein